MFLCQHFDKADLTAWERKLSAWKTLNNAKVCFVDKYMEKMAYKKVMARKLEYANQVREVAKS